MYCSQFMHALIRISVCISLFCSQNLESELSPLIMKLWKLCPNLTLSHPKWTVCRAAGYSVCVCVSCGGFCLAPVPASILGRGCGCVARAGSRCPGAGRVTAVVGCQDDERPSGTQGAAPRWWAGTCRRSRARQNRDKSLKEPDSRAQHHAPEDAVRETHTHTRQNSSIINTCWRNASWSKTHTNSLKLAMHFSFDSIAQMLLF